MVAPLVAATYSCGLLLPHTMELVTASFAVLADPSRGILAGEIPDGAKVTVSASGNPRRPPLR